MQVGLVLLWRVDLNDQCNVIHVDAACGHVGCDENAHLTAREALEVAVALVLVEVSVQTSSWNARLGEALAQSLGSHLGACKDQRLAGTLNQAQQHCAAVIRLDYEDSVGDVGGVVLFVRNFIHVWVWQELANQCVDLAVEGCREQQLLTVAAGAHHTTNTLDEAEVAHVVCLVNNQGLNLAEVDDALSHKVFEATRGGHDDVYAAAHAGLLLALRNTAVDANGVKADWLG